MTNTRQTFLALGLAAAMTGPALFAVTAPLPAAAQSRGDIGFDSFYQRLAPYGRWSNHPRWGDVWQPTGVGRDFRPYYDGHWEDTREYGWLWVSDESWGDLPYHYGRWLFDPDEGWFWVPGYVWGPSWVVWRSGGGNIGWFPMPPGDDYDGDGTYRDAFDSEYGYRDWYGPSFDNDRFFSLWIFVGQDHFRDRDFHAHALPSRDVRRIIPQTRDSTHYATVNNYVVNRSVDRDRLQRDTKQQFQAVPARSVLGSKALVTQAETGRQVEQRERQRRPTPQKDVPRNAASSPEVPANANTRGNRERPAAQTPAPRAEMPKAPPSPDVEQQPRSRGAPPPDTRVPEAPRSAPPNVEPRRPREERMPRDNAPGQEQRAQPRTQPEERAREATPTPVAPRERANRPEPDAPKADSDADQNDKRRGKNKPDDGGDRGRN